VRDLQRFSDLPNVACCSRRILHHAGTADDFEIANFCQFCQEIVLNTIGKERVLSVMAQVLQRQHGDARRRRLSDRSDFPDDHNHRYCQGCQRCHQPRSERVSAHPLPSASENSCAPRMNRLMFEPAVKIFGQC
jgi:hypothetical protein